MVKPPDDGGPYRGRFAPSPTGPMHLGMARTFLCAWLDARKNAGRILLRIEDVDTVRAKKESPDEIRRDLEWLGLDWDEGPVFQHDRFERYERVLEDLRAAGRAFACSCTRRELQVASAPHGPEDEGPPYPGTCRNGPAQPERRTALRFRTEANDLVRFEDLCFGSLEEAVHSRVGDFVLRRSDGLFAYQLAVVVDDLDQGITRVVRGQDLLASSGRQVLLRKTLAPEAPPLGFLHVPLLFGPSGERLATRHGAPSIADMRARGLRPSQVIGGLAASLGLVSTETEASARELIEAWRTGPFVEAPLPKALA